MALPEYFIDSEVCPPCRVALAGAAHYCVGSIISSAISYTRDENMKIAKLEEVEMVDGGPIPGGGPDIGPVAYICACEECSQGKHRGTEMSLYSDSDDDEDYDQWEPVPGEE